MLAWGHVLRVEQHTPATHIKGTHQRPILSSVLCSLRERAEVPGALLQQFVPLAGLWHDLYNQNKKEF